MKAKNSRFLEGRLISTDISRTPFTNIGERHNIRRSITSGAQLARATEYTDYVSTEGQDSPKECPVMTLNNLIVRLH